MARRPPLPDADIDTHGQAEDRHDMPIALAA